MKFGNDVEMKNVIDSWIGCIVYGVYVNEIGKFYGLDMYDFYIYVYGEFGNINNVIVNVLVFLCDILVCF